MADIVLSADAAKVAQVRSANITAYDAATTYKVTIGGKVVSQIGTGGTATATATAFATALNASTYPEFAEITWSSNTSNVIGTMDTSGKSFVCTSSVSGGAGTFGAFSDTTANDGPKAVTANNFKDVATGVRQLPVNSDTLTMESIEEDLLYGLDALSSVTVAGLYIESSMTGNTGLPLINEDAATTYDEYRPAYFVIGATVAIIGAGEDGDGSGQIMLDNSNVQTTCTVRKTASAELDGLKAFIWKGTHASNVLRVEGDSTVDIAPFAGEVATIATLTCTGESDVRTSIGTTLGTVNADSSSTLEINSATALADITAINIRDSATVTMYGDNPVTTVTINGQAATLDLRSSGTITTLNLYDGATLDVDQNPAGVTITTINVFGPCTIKDKNSKLTVTNAIANASQVTFDIDPKRAMTLGAP